MLLAAIVTIVVCYIWIYFDSGTDDIFLVYGPSFRAALDMKAWSAFGSSGWRLLDVPKYRASKIAYAAILTLVGICHRDILGSEFNSMTYDSFGFSATYRTIVTYDQSRKCPRWCTGSPDVPLSPIDAMAIADRLIKSLAGTDHELKTLQFDSVSLEFSDLGCFAGVRPDFRFSKPTFN